MQSPDQYTTLAATLKQERRCIMCGCDLDALGKPPQARLCGCVSRQHLANMRKRGELTPAMLELPTALTTGVQTHTPDSLVAALERMITTLQEQHAQHVALLRQQLNAQEQIIQALRNGTIVTETVQVQRQRVVIDEDMPAITVTEDTTTNSGQNFLNSMFALQ